jgi:hypothetical protein
MEDDSNRPPEQTQNEDARVTIPVGKARSDRITASVIGALVLLALDVAHGGTYLCSSMACPIWFLASILKNAIQRPGWKVALLRIAIPALTLGLVLANNAFQWRIANANGARIIAACEEFHAANGKYPKTLDELVPRYLPSIPRAKYCLKYGEFLYFDKKPMLMWYAVPPFGTEVYNFEKKRWSYID